MPRSSPEKLAAALRANLKRRKAPTVPKGPEDGQPAGPASLAQTPSQILPQTPPKPPKKSGEG
jgi:hypothetical protein